MHDRALPCRPAYITFENLEIKNATTPYTFTDDAGAVTSYVANAAGFWIVDGKNITIRNCYIHDCGNGVLTYTADSGADNWTQDMLLEGNYITNCGNSGSTRSMAPTCESYRITYQYNHYGPPRGGDTPPSAMTSRTAAPARRPLQLDRGRQQMLDLIDSEDSETLANEPEYHKTYIYGNVLIERNDAGNRQIIHFGQDAYMYPRQKGYFYNNTIISNRTGATTLVCETAGRRRLRRPQQHHLHDRRGQHPGDRQRQRRRAST